MKNGIIFGGIFLAVVIVGAWYLTSRVFTDRDEAELRQLINNDSSRTESTIFNPVVGDPEAEPTSTKLATTVPISEEAIKNCPVSIPNGKSGPWGSYFGFNYGNENETMFTVLQDDGRWKFWPDGPGEIHADGSLSIKWPWGRTVPGDLRISGERLDAPAPNMPEVILRGEEDGYGETGFHPSRITFPSEGCWQVTAEVSTEILVFVLLVVLEDN